MSFRARLGKGRGRRDQQRPHQHGIRVLLDVVMESEHAGLDLARYIREELENHHVRIVLRTEARSLALPMLARHDIGDHRRKAELSPQRLRAVLAGAVRAYVQHCRIDANRRSLARIVQSGAALMEQTDLRGFAAAVITQLAGLLGVAPQGLVCVRETGAASGCRVLAATGDFAARRQGVNDELDILKTQATLEKPQKRRTGFNPITGLIQDLDTGEVVAGPDGPGAGMADLPRASSPEQVAALPPGASFIAPDGSIRRKPGGPTQSASGGFPDGQ